MKTLFFIMLINLLLAMTSCAGKNGSNGSPGIDGKNGANGLDGRDGADGVDGEDGEDAPDSPYAIVGMVDPCGKQSNHDEVFILLSNGQLIASFSANVNGDYTRFSSLIPNANSSFSGMTTDGTGCTISIIRDGNNNVTMITSNHVGELSWTLH